MVIMENRKPVVGYESLYEVSDLGRVNRQCQRSRIEEKARH